MDEGAAVVITPHLTNPIDDDKKPGEQDMLYNGTYNLGFMAVRRCDESMRLLRWWGERCMQHGFSEGRTGLFVDQKWMNLAPGMFKDIAILRHPGINMAYWNLHERALREDGAGYVVTRPASKKAYISQLTEYQPDARLSFFHFSGIVVEDPAVLSNNTDRYALADRPDLAKIFAAYKAAVIANKSAAIEQLPYGFDRFSDGTVVTRLARRIYSKHEARWAGQDPYDASGEFARFAKKMGLVQGKDAPQKATWRQFDPNDGRVRMVHRLLRLALRVLGPNRYELLMRYLGHITVLRNQSVFLDDE
jgi:hypothetical protein